MEHVTQNSTRKILVITWNRMGDLLQLSPIFDSFRKQFPEYEIHLSVAHSFAAIAHGFAGVTKVIPFNLNELLAAVSDTSNIVDAHHKLSTIVTSLQSEKYDLVINLTHNRLTALFTHLLKAPNTRGLIFDEVGYRAVRDPWSRFFFLADLNRGQSRINLVDIQLGIAGFHPGSPMNLLLDPVAQAKIEHWITSNQLDPNRLVAIQTGASQPNKEWKHSSFAEIGRRLLQNGYTPIWVGTNGEKSKIDPIALAVPGSINLAGETSVPELAALLQRCRLLLTNDTGTMHVGVCVGTSIISLNVGTPLSHETGPYGVGHTVMEPVISCYPCSFHVECPHFKCHDVLDVESVWAVVTDRLKLPATSQVRAQVRVWHTYFDENGFWELRRETPESASPEEIIAVIWGEIWKRILAHQSAVNSLEAGIDLRLQREYLAPSIPTSLSTLAQRSSVLQQFVAIADLGVRTAAELVAKNPATELPRIIELGNQLEAIEAELQKCGLVYPVWRPLFALFVLGKDALVGDNITDLARQTQALYHEIVRVGTLLQQQLDRLQQQYLVIPLTVTP